MNWLKKMFLSKKNKEEKASEEGLINENESNEGVHIVFDLDELEGDAPKNLAELFAEKMNFGVFKGNIKHAYTLKIVKNQTECPRCGEKTEQLYTDLVYTTGAQLRVSTGPSGYFCTHCPTIIIDEAVIAEGVAHKYNFEAVVGLDKHGKFQAFNTWNGSKSIYIMDENEVITGISNEKLEGQQQRRKKRRSNPSSRKRFRRKK